MGKYRTPPTDDLIVAAFTTYVNERAEAGVMIAQAAVDVRFADGEVTVVLDPATAGAEYWALMETAAHRNPADLFATPAAFDDEDGIWLRGRVATVRVIDVDDRTLGVRSTAELNDYATGSR